MDRVHHAFAAAHAATGGQPRRPTSLLMLGAVCTLVIICVLYTGSLFAAGALPGPTMQPGADTQDGFAALVTGMPAIFVQGGAEGTVGGLVDVLIAFDSGGSHVAALSFSFNYDADCLALPLDDEDANGTPDAIRFNSSAQFFTSVRIHPSDGQLGRIDIMLVDYLPPLAALRDNAALVSIQFRIVCPLAPGLITYAHVGFSSLLPVGFGDPNGQDLTGLIRDGVVRIIGAIPGEETPTPTVTPVPPTGSPTPTPTLIATTPSTPTPVVLVEIIAAPAPHTDGSGVVFVLDYVVLSPANNITLAIPLPQHTYFDATTSSLGWQCGSEIINKHCRFTLYAATNPNNMSGRIFFGTALNWPLPAHVTEIEFIAMIEVNGEVVTQIGPLILPIVSGGPIAEPGILTLTLDTPITELEAGRDHELPYTLTYTNSGQTDLQQLTLHLVMPHAATLHALADAPFTWVCPPLGDGQANCTLDVGKLTPGAHGETRFVVALEPSSLQTMATVVVIVYATDGGQLVSSSSSGLPIRQPEETGRVTWRLFLPVVMRGTR